MTKVNSKSLFRGVFASIVVCVVALSLVGCSSSQNDTEVSDGTKTIIDAYGREVTVANDVNRVATIGSGARFVVYAGGAEGVSKLVAVTEMETSPSPTRPYSIAYADEFADLVSTSNGNHILDTNVNSELLLSISPDVIISSRSAQECDDLQNEIGIPVIGIYYDGESSLFDETVYTSILSVGQAIGTEDHAESVVEALQGWQADLQERTDSIPEDERVTCYFGAINYRGAKSFAGTYANYEPAEIVNAINVADETGADGAIDIDLEQLGVWDPEYIFLNTANMDLMREDYASLSSFFDQLSAFQNGNLYSQPSITMNGTNIEMGVCNAYFVGSVIYPQYFADLDMSEVYSEILSIMLDVDYYPILQSQGLDFVQLDISQFE